MAQLFDGLICLLPFEPDYFKNEGLDARFCGHPILEAFSNKLSSGFTKESPEKHPNHILIFPGSRMGEVKRMAPIFRETFNQMKTMNPDLQAHIVAFDEFRNMLDEEFLGLNYIYIDPENRYGAMLNAPFALAKSGTVGLELAVANCPHVIAYKMNKVTWQILKRLVKTPYAHLANILAGKEIIPECIQDNCNAEYIMQRILHDLPEDMRFIREKLKGENPNLTPSEQAADYVLEMLK
jgi:lipid-A-disaccharide synthase